MSSGIEKYLPAAALPLIQKWWNELDFQLRITKKRTSKLGDFRPSLNGKQDKISVNGDLGKYHFLITLTHEIAHAYVWKKYGRKAKPHGVEWKSTYIELVAELHELKIFPMEIEAEIEKHISRPKASSCADPNLYKALTKIEADQEIIFLEDLNEGSDFYLQNGKHFIKGKKRRSRFECRSLDNNRMYYVSGHAEVSKIG